MPKRKDWSILNRIANLIVKHPGKTGAELSKMLDMPGAYRRLSEVRALGLARKGAKKICEVSGKMADTWWPDDAPEIKKLPYTDKQIIKKQDDRIKYLEGEVSRLKRLVDESSFRPN